MAATLADSFLADLDDLSDNEEAPQEPGAGGGMEEGSDGDEEEEETMDLEALNYDDLDAVAKLQKSARYIDMMRRVEAALEASDAQLATIAEEEGTEPKSEQQTQGQSKENSQEQQGSTPPVSAASAAAAAVAAGLTPPSATTTTASAATASASAATASSTPAATAAAAPMDESEYQLIVDCNGLAVDIDNEITIVHNFIRDNYRLKFPELESLVLHPIDYARVVRRIGNEMDLTVVDLEGLLPSATIMVVSVTASTTTGRPLPDDALQRTMEACDRALALDDAKKKVLRFVESRMGGLAPNLSAVVGSAIAAQLVGVAGGLMALASMPACNIQVLGSKRKTLSGFSTATSLPHTGFLFHCEVVQATPPPLRMRATRLVAGKCALAARVDATHGDLSGGAGRRLRVEMERKIDKWQEPPPAKQPKPLPVPDAEPKKRRGGRRLRKMKERYGITDMRKLANRMQFGVEEQSTLGDGLGEGYGMLGQAGSGRLRVAAAASNLKTKVAKKFKERSYGSSGNTSGLSSSLAFTPIQGIELTNPQAAQMSHLGSGTQSTYFSETGTFSKIKKP
ncbi:unnamed protein product [Closterium sp. NIES-65]|nr:unnamed protein product [Closterium sp. NIES-65]